MVARVRDLRFHRSHPSGKGVLMRLSEAGNSSSPGPQIAGLVLHMNSSKLISAPGFLGLGIMERCLAARHPIGQRAPCEMRTAEVIIRGCPQGWWVVWFGTARS